MIRQFLSLCLALVLGVIVWSFYQRTTWDQDYTHYTINYPSFPPLDTTFESRINPKYFAEATIITNDTHLCYPEDIAVSSQGIIYTGLIDGSVVAVTPKSNRTEVIFKGNQTGRILGLIISSDDSTLYLASDLKGLIKLDIATGKADYLLNNVDEGQIKALNSIGIDEDRQILYMTDSSSFRIPFFLKDLIIGQQTGRVIGYDLKTGEAKVLLDKIAFANGIVFEKETNSIIFAEFNRFTIWRYRIAEQKKEVLIDNLFGYPDNLKLNEKGELLVAMPTTRSFLSEVLLRYPIVKQIALYLPSQAFCSLSPKRAGGVRIDPKTGKIMEYLFGAPSKITFVTTILQRNNKTYFSSFINPTILVLNSNASRSRQVSYDMYKLNHGTLSLSNFVFCGTDKNSSLVFRYSKK